MSSRNICWRNRFFKAVTHQGLVGVQEHASDAVVLQVVPTGLAMQKHHELFAMLVPQALEHTTGEVTTAPEFHGVVSPSVKHLGLREHPGSPGGTSPDVAARGPRCLDQEHTLPGSQL